MSVKLNVKQGTLEWLSLRQNYITATDAAVIMKMSKWKTPYQLYHEKTGPVVESVKTPAMERGILLEPAARELLEIELNCELFPDVVVKDDWAMASLDGLSPCGTLAVEIKCPGPKDHSLALQGRIPDHYFPQVQHQLYVTELDSMYYYSFDGIDGVLIKVDRDQKFIENMISMELDFYRRLQRKNPPDLETDDFEIRTDSDWAETSERWMASKKRLEQAQEEEALLKDKLLKLAGRSNARGAGISVCQVTRKGPIDYSAIPELKGLDLEKYRKPETTYAKIIA